jgi:hypothetical protein
MNPESFGFWPEVWSLPGLAWTQLPGSLALACLLLVSATACTSEPTPAPETTRPPTTNASVEVTTSTTAARPATPASTVAGWTHDELRVELLEMMRQDQLERTGDGLPPGTPLPPIQDYARATRLDEIVDEIGWPTFDMVGHDGATAAWLIAQHADHDPNLQARWLELIDAAAQAGQADPTEVAYLADRVAVNQDKPQRYGTQIRCRNGSPAPATPIQDEASVDERRRNVGLEPLAGYYDELAMMCAQEDAQGQSPAD